MKKLLSLLLIMSLCLSGVAFADEAATDILIAPAPQAEIPIKIISDSKIVKTDTVVVEQRTLVPLRALLESTNAEVEWDNPTQTASVTRGGKTISVTIGSNIMKTPGGDVTLEVAPILHEGTTTYAPLRAIAEEFGIKVDWDNGTKTILVTTPDGCPYVDFYDGATLSSMVEQGAFTKEEFESISTLSYEENKDKLYAVVENSIPMSAIAQINNVSVSDFKAMLTLSESYPDSTPWGEALGDIPFGAYLYIFEGMSSSGMTIDESVAMIRELYGLGTEYTASTPYKYVRTIMDNQNLEYQKEQAAAQEKQLAEDLEKLPELTKNKLYFTITLSDGSKMKGELYPDLAPITVENFVNLVKAKFYDGLIFHRVIDGFMIQGGGYDKDMKAKETGSAAIKGEFYANGVSNALKHEKGVISMARTNEPDSATSQFFIVDETSEHLDGNYAAFGKITTGLNVLDKISQTETATNDMGMTDVPVKPVVIKTIRMTK